MSRRKALKTTISAGGLVTGLSTGALADDEDEDSVARGPPSNPGRGRPFAKPDVPDEWLTDDWRFDIPQEVLDEVDVEAYDARTKQQINGATARAVNPNEADLSTQQDAVSTLGGVEYTVTLVDETQNGFTLTIEAGIVADLAAGEANVSLTIDFNGFVFEFLSVGLTRGEGKNIRLEPNPRRRFHSVSRSVRSSGSKTTTRSNSAVRSTSVSASTAPSQWTVRCAEASGSARRSTSELVAAGGTFFAHPCRGVSWSCARPAGTIRRGGQILLRI